MALETYCNTIVDLDGHVYLEDIPATFFLEEIQIEGEPFHDGSGRREADYTEISARLVSLNIGSLIVTRTQAILMFGDRAIQAVEEATEENIADKRVAA